MISSEMDQLQYSVQDLLNTQEKKEFLKTLSTYKSNKNIDEFIDNLQILLDTPAKQTLIGLIRGIILPADLHVFDNRTRKKSISLKIENRSPIGGDRKIRNVQEEEEEEAEEDKEIIEGNINNNNNNDNNNNNTRLIRIDDIPSHHHHHHPENGLNLGFSIRGGYDYGTGIYVSYVDTDSLADAHGLSPGDLILSVNGIDFHNLTHLQAAKIIRCSKYLEMCVKQTGKLPGSMECQQRYCWVDASGRSVSPPPKAEHGHGGDRVEEDDVTRFLSSNGIGGCERKVNLDLTDQKPLGLMIRGGKEFGLGIYVTGVSPRSTADKGGLKVGDEILHVNNIPFENLCHQEAVDILKHNSYLMMTVRNIGKLPYSKTTYDQTVWYPKQSKSINSPRESIESIGSSSSSNRREKKIMRTFQTDTTTTNSRRSGGNNNNNRFQIETHAEIHSYNEDSGVELNGNSSTSSSKLAMVSTDRPKILNGVLKKQQEYLHNQRQQQPQYKQNYYRFRSASVTHKLTNSLNSLRTDDEIRPNRKFIKKSEDYRNFSKRGKDYDLDDDDDDDDLDDGDVYADDDDDDDDDDSILDHRRNQLNENENNADNYNYNNQRNYNNNNNNNTKKIPTNETYSRTIFRNKPSFSSISDYGPIKPPRKSQSAQQQQQQQQIITMEESQSSSDFNEDDWCFDVGVGPNERATSYQRYSPSIVRRKKGDELRNFTFKQQQNTTSSTTNNNNSKGQLPLPEMLNGGGNVSPKIDRSPILRQRKSLSPLAIIRSTSPSPIQQQQQQQQQRQLTTSSRHNTPSNFPHNTTSTPPPIPPQLSNYEDNWDRLSQKTSCMDENLITTTTTTTTNNNNNNKPITTTIPSETPPPTTRKTIKVIKMYKLKPILGLAIEGGANTTKRGALPLPRIINIQAGGCAQTSSLKVGQVICKVDQIDLNGMSHSDIAKLIAKSFKDRRREYVEFEVMESKTIRL